MRVRVVLVSLLIVGSTAGLVAGEVSAGASISGVTIPLGPETEQRQLETAEELIESGGVEIPDTAYALTTPSNDQYIVLTDGEPQVAEVTVRGDVYPHPTFAGFILADSISGTRTGEPVTVRDLRENTSKYRNDLVQVQSSTLRASYTLDPAENTFVYQPGLHVETGSEARLNWTHPGRAAREVVKNVSGRSFGGGHRVLSPGKTRLVGASPHKRVWWGTSQTTMNGAVVGEDGGLFVGKTSVPGTTVTDTSELHHRTGEVVTINATLRGASISAQETLLEAANCGEGLVVFPSTGCAPVPADVVVHSGVAYTGTPSKPSDAVYYVGLSSTIQTTPINTESGQYQLTGRVVSASRLDPRLNGTAVFILDRKRVGTISGSAPSALPDVNTTALLREQIVMNRSTWGSTHPEANTLGNFEQRQTPEQATTTAATMSPTSTSAPPKATTASPTSTPTDSGFLVASPTRTPKASSSLLEPLQVSTEVFLGISGVALIMTLSGIILTASRVHHSIQETEPPFSTRGYLVVWGLAAASLSASLVLADLEIALWSLALAVFVAGWAVVLRRLFW